MPAVKFMLEREEHYWDCFVAAAGQHQLEAACADPEAGVMALTQCMSDAAVQAVVSKQGEGSGHANILCGFM